MSNRGDRGDRGDAARQEGETKHGCVRTGPSGRRKLTPMNVRERQNDQRSLDRLVAQRFLYRQVKTVENWRLLSVVVVAGLLLWGLAAEGGPFSQAATIIVVSLWFVDQVVLVRFASRMKQEAAAIQEDFDCFVLDIPWPKYGGAEQPTEDRVYELARKGSKLAVVRESLEGWYGGDDIPADPLAARLYCQRANCRWDGRLRKEWIWFISSVVAVLGVVGFVVAALVGVSLLEVVLAAAAGLRLLAWLLIELRVQSLAKKRMERLHGYLSRADTQAGQMTLCDVRLVQAAIFEHRRACPTVPDWFFRFRRKSHEAMEPG